MASPFGKGVHYCKQAKVVIGNVYNFFEKKWEEKHAGNSSSGDRRNIVKDTMEATGMKSRTALWSIRKHGPTSPAKRGPTSKSVINGVDSFDRGVIRRIVSSMYVQKTWPTVTSVHAKVKEEIGFEGSLTSFHTLLTDMGYKYSTRPTRELLKERPDVVAKKHEYLTKMKKLREIGCPFVYIDETFLHQNHTVSKCWLIDGEGGLKVPSGKGSRLIILHAGSREGFINDGLLCFQSKTGSADYHDEMNAEVFTHWLKNSLFPNIPENTCIIMDNASYHSVKDEKVPNMSSRKGAMQEWLTSNNVAWDEAMIKPQLYALVQIHKPRLTKYVIDELARANGHFVLRLPPYHCELNPIELIWSQIKGEVAVKNTSFKMSEVKSLLEKAIANVTPENWAAAERHVIDLENSLFDAEVKIDTTLPEDQLASFRFAVNDSDDDTDSGPELEDDFWSEVEA